MQAQRREVERFRMDRVKQQRIVRSKQIKLSVVSTAWMLEGLKLANDFRWRAINPDHKQLRDVAMCAIEQRRLHRSRRKHCEQRHCV